jgi:acetyltransferase AlgX (SGNH hydrolase-like protein)
MGRSLHRPPAVLKTVLRAAAGIALAIGIAEAAFHFHDHGAFPHLNGYVSDAQLGVRLRPSASQRIALGENNPITSVRVNREGLRGADLPAPTEGEILVVGDSQVFGLGVEEQETASAELGRILGGPLVINAGVPTYGPPEYNGVVQEMLAQRRITTVVYVVNLIDDLFEASHPNTERHAVWDGWAVRKETAPGAITTFPGRDILFRRSHLVYAFRSRLRSGPQIDDRGFATESAAPDLVLASARARDERDRAERETKPLKEKRHRELEDATTRLLAAEVELERLAIATFSPPGGVYKFSLPGVTNEVYRQSRNNPGDHEVSYHALGVMGSERSDTNWQQAMEKVVLNGGEVRREMEARIRVFAELAPQVAAGDWRSANGGGGGNGSPSAWVREGFPGSFSGNPNMIDELRKGREHPLVRALEQRNALKQRVEALRAAPAEIIQAWSPLTPLLREAKAACDAHGARLLVVALPMDVQVSPDEWNKYGATNRIDMAPTKILIDDVVASAEAIGALGLDATPALAQAEPGAFLGRDNHLSTRGHKALAEAIARSLKDTP